MTTTIDGNSFVTDASSIDDTDSPYTTQDEQYIYVDTSSGSVTVTLASADVENGREIRIVDTGTNAGTNSITINTEGSETINPGANSSITLTVDGTYVDLFSDGSNWFSDRASEKQTVSTDKIATTLTLQDVTSNRSLESQETNTSGSDISAYIRIDVSASTTVGINATVDGFTVDRVNRSYDNGDSFILQIPRIPDGANYNTSVFAGSADISLTTWNELRP
jgi:hypothetical protein